MSNIHITKELGTFDAAHQLPTHHGKCHNLHGHTYKVSVTVAGSLRSDPSASDFGMVIDFSTLKEVYKERVENVCDHALLLGSKPLPWLIQMSTLMATRNSVDNFVADELAHKGIGKVAYLPIPVTTAEMLAKWMYNEMMMGLWAIPSAHGIELISVTVWETPTSEATYFPPDMTIIGGNESWLS